MIGLWARWWPMRTRAPADSASRTSASASATVGVIGFSSSIGRPAATLRAWRRAADGSVRIVASAVRAVLDNPEHLTAARRIAVSAGEVVDPVWVIDRVLRG